MTRQLYLPLLFLNLAVFSACYAKEKASWAEGAVWYQIFPERFRNGDTANDINAENHPDHVKLTTAKPVWKTSSWTADWYQLTDYERALGCDFYSCVSLRRYGGDFQGIIDRLDYLKSLGVNALYLNPVFQADSHHKYDWTCLHHADPYFGPDPQGDLNTIQEESLDPTSWKWTSADKLLIKLVAECHIRQIHIVLDGVLNHCGRGFPAFQDIRKNGAESRFLNWFSNVDFTKRSGYPNDGFDYRGWNGGKSLPEFAEKSGRLHPELESYILAACRRWMDPDADGNPADGIDGWRLDVADEVSPVFWRFWHDQIKKVNPAVETFAETWKDPAWLIGEGQFSAAMNYYAFAIPTKEFVIDKTLSSAECLKVLKERSDRIPAPARLKMMNILDSHDTDRIASMISNRKRKNSRGYNVNNRVAKKEDQYLPSNMREEDSSLLQLAAFLQFTWSGSPMIYYGTEAGMWGGGDPDNRMPMLWSDLRYENQSADPIRRPRRPDPVVFSDKRFKFYQELITFHQNHRALVLGDLEIVDTQIKDDLLAFCRSVSEQKLFIILNRNPSERTLKLPGRWGTISGHLWRPLYCTKGDLTAIRLVQTGREKGLKIPGESGAVLQVLEP